MSTDRYCRYLILALLLLAAPVFAEVRVSVDVTGLSGETLANVRAALSLAQREDQEITLRMARDLHSRAEVEIQRALQPFGYYRPVIDATLAPAGDQNRWLATYRVAAGEPVRVARLQLDLESGADANESLAELLAAWPLPQGQVLDHRLYRQGKEAILAGARKLGFLDAELSVHRVEVDPAAYSATIMLRLDTGPRYRFGRITFDSDEFDQHFLRKFLVIEEGAPYSTGLVAEQRRLLSASGLFREVEIEQLAPNPRWPAQVPLRIALVPFPPNRYRGRLAWGTDTGFGVWLGWTRRYVGRRGQNFSLGVASVEERNKLAGDLNYTIPIDPISGSRFKLGARHEGKDLSFTDVELDEGGETRIETNLASVLWQAPGFTWGGFAVIPELGFSLVEEEYDVFEVLFGNLPQSAQDVIRLTIGEEAYDTLTPDFSVVAAQGRLTMRRADERLFIRSGDFLRFDLLFTDEAMGSNIDLWQARLETWNIRALGERGRVLVRSNLGYSEADNREVLSVNFNEIPDYYEFRAGGARSVRGYGFESLFPEDTITGGKHELVLSLEYEHEVYPGWGVAGFVDAGNAFNSWTDYDEKIGVGIGVRWRSPVGLFRVDLGVPLDDADESFEVYITVGPEF